MNITGIFGGYPVSTLFHPLPLLEFIRNFAERLTIKDLIISQIKSLVFGFSVAIISCFQGLKVNFASTEVPQRTIKAVFSSLTWIVLFDVIITIISYSF